MTRSEIMAHNAGVGALATLAAVSAAAMRSRLCKSPTRYNFAVAALEAIVDSASEFMLPLPPDGTEPAAIALPKPSPSRDGEAAPLAIAR